MTRTLQQLTAGGSCWSADVLQNVKRAVAEIETLRQRDARHDVHQSTPVAADLAAFQQWLQTHACRPHGEQTETLSVTVQPVGGAGHGLVAVDAIAEGDAFISIPYDMILASDPTLGPPSVATLSDHGGICTTGWEEVAHDPLLSRFPSCLLALRLLAEACPSTTRQSFFHAYISILPVRFDIPLFFDQSDFVALEGTPLFAPAVKLLYNSIKQFYYLRQLRARWTSCPIPSEAFTLTNYFWAMGVVLTRQNEVAVTHSTDSAAQTALALIPGWDMCNHEQGERITTFSDPVQRMITCHAARDFQRDEQVTMFYGPRSNDHLLLYSGFIIPNNAFNRVRVLIPLRTEDPLAKIRRLLIQKEAALHTSLLTDEGIHIEVNARGEIMSVVMQRAIQLAFMDKTNLTAALRSSAIIAAAESESVYIWSTTERQTAMHAWMRSCKVAKEQLDAKCSHVATAPRGALFKGYLEGQSAVISTTLQNEAILPAA